MKPAWWFWQHLLPIAPMDYAKLFLWCFISGFAERFIPDMIDNLVDRADAPKSNASAGKPMIIPPGGQPDGTPPPPVPPVKPAPLAAPQAAASPPEGQPPEPDGKPVE
jgi:hypothetical protein